MSEMFRRPASESPSRGRWLALVTPCLYWFALPLASWIGWEFHLAEKVLTAFVMPAGLIANLLLLSWCLHWWCGSPRWRSISWCLAFVAWMLLCNPLLAKRACMAIEAPWLSVRPQGQYEWVAILGGGVSVGFNGQPQIGREGQRALMGAQLYHSGATKHLIALGGGVRGVTAETDLAIRATRDLLQSLNVPAEAIEDITANNTKEEMRAIQLFLADHGAESDRLGVVTSAFHMTRAARLAKQINLKIEPLPTAFRVGSPRAISPIDLVPNSESLNDWAVICKEKLARLVGR